MVKKKKKAKDSTSADSAEYKSVSWATKYRPRTLDDVYGQKSAVAQLKTMIETRSIPPAILFTGSTGTGKTTLARVLARTINGSNSRDLINDFEEINFGDKSKIDDVRAIIKSMCFAPQSGALRITMLDEFHAGNSKASYNALLKPLEEPPESAFWMFATDQPDKLSKTILGRCQMIRLSEPDHKDTGKLLLMVAKKEKVRDLFDNKKQIIKISELCAGQPRSSLQSLQTVVRTMQGGGSYNDGLTSCMKATSEGSQVDLYIALLVALYSGSPVRIIRALSKVENFHGCISKMLELNQYILDKMCKLDTYRSFDRVALEEALKSANFDIKKVSLAIRVHEKLVTLRERMNGYAVQEFHLAVVHLTK